MKLQGRELGNLERARQKGFLDQRNQHREAMRAAHERWCWSMKLPIVRIGRRSPGSRYCLLVLEMYTTPNTLSAEGQQALVQLAGKAGCHGEQALSPYGGEFGKVPHAAVEKFAHEVFRVGTTLGYYVPDLALFEARRRKYAQAGPERRRAAIA